MRMCKYADVRMVNGEGMGEGADVGCADVRMEECADGRICGW
jgi:hypothetical protein